MTTTQQNVPVLRFKDEQGNDYLEWEEKRLGEICSTFKSGNGITMSRIVAKGNYPVYGGNGLRGYTDSFTHEGYFLLIGRQGALCGNINRSNGKAYVSEHAIAVQANNGNDTEWLAQKLDIYNLNRLSESSAQPGLSVSKLARFKLFVPELTEQQKIAAFLSSIDTKIEQLNKKKALWEQYKKGMMQKLFSQEFRFKDERGKDCSDWNKRKLPDFSEINKGKSIVRNDIVNEGYPVIAGGQRSPYCHSSFTHENVITVSASGASAGYVSYHPHKIWASDCSVVRAKSSSCTLFVYYLLNHLQTRIYALQSGGAQPHVYPKDLYTLTVTIPVSSKEQQKIAEFLSSIARKIELVSTEINQAQAFKKGLLQQMFI